MAHVHVYIQIGQEVLNMILSVDKKNLKKAGILKIYTPSPDNINTDSIVDHLKHKFIIAGVVVLLSKTERIEVEI